MPVPIGEVVGVALQQRVLARRLGPEAGGIQAAHHDPVHEIAKGREALVVVYGSNARERRFRPVHAVLGSLRVIVPIELDLAQLALEQRLSIGREILPAHATLPGGALVLHFQAVAKPIRTQPSLDLEGLQIAILPASKRSCRKRIGRGHPDRATQKTAQREHDVEHGRLARTVPSEKERQLLKRQIEVDQALVIVDVESLQH